MYRAIAKFGRPEPLTHTDGVLPIDLEMVLDKSTDRPHFVGHARDDPPTAQVGDLVDGVAVLVLFALDLFGKAGDLFGPCLHDGVGGQSSGRCLKHLAKDLGKPLVTRANLSKLFDRVEHPLQPRIIVPWSHR